MSPSELHFVDKIEGYRDDTVIQTSRLYGYHVAKGYLLMGDIDMIPLTDIWTRDLDRVNCFGWDLTDKTQIPICYIGGSDDHMRTIFKNGGKTITESIKIELDKNPQAKNPDFYKYWFTDQDIATEKIKEYGFQNVLFHDRGKYPSGYAVGRVDRGKWDLNLDCFIDCHMMRNAYKDSNAFMMNMEIIRKMFGDKFNWIPEYTDKYRSLHGEIYG